MRFSCEYQWRISWGSFAPPEKWRMLQGSPCGAIRYIPHVRAAKFSLYLHYSRACAAACARPGPVHLLGAFGRNPSDDDVPTESCIGGHSRPRNIPCAHCSRVSVGIVSRFRRRKVKIREDRGSVSRAQRSKSSYASDKNRGARPGALNTIASM